MRFKGYITAILLSIILVMSTKAQDNLGFKFKSVTINPLGNKNHEFYTGKIDGKGVLVFEPGVELSYEYYVLELLRSIRITKGLYNDGVGNFAGYITMGMWWRIHEKWKHTMRFGIGPSFNYRTSRLGIEGYPEDSYVGTGEYQHIVMFNAGLEYNFYMSKKSELTFSLSLTHPWGLSFAAGYRFWISKKIIHRKNCNC